MKINRTKRQQDCYNALLSCATAWWISKRPIEYRCGEHYQNPTVNCVTIAEKNLAKAIAEAINVLD